jgi:sterol desaturase/sphingolipid hydroxylase (fatty acid hydroxylase superfamily)
MTASAVDPGIAVASGIRTLGDAGARFARLGSPRVLAAGLLLAVGARLTAALAGDGGFGWWDLFAVSAVVVLTPFVEWFIHLVVLHRRPFTVGSVRIDPGAGHREHHRNPATINWVVLRGVDAAVFQVLLAGLVIVVVGGPMMVVGSPAGSWSLGPVAAGPVLTGIVAAVAGLAHYEWTHFLFHTAYRPRTRYYRRLKANHRLHHWRNERYWLGVTTNLGDRVLGTYPQRSAVPRSATATTLGPEPQAQPDRPPAGE